MSSEENCSCGDCSICGYADDGYDQDEDGDNTQSGGFIGDKYDAFRRHLESVGFHKVNYGSFRATYIRGKVVVKVPRNMDGEIDNRVEAAGWRKYKSNPTKDGILMAPCRLLPNGCLMMAAVEQCYVDPHEEGTKHSWVAHIEGWQVGKYRGKIVAYDYALDIPERRQWEKEWGVESDFFNTR